MKTPRRLRASLVVFALVMGAALVLAGCDSTFEEINKNTNEPEVVSPDLLLPGVIRGPINTSVTYAHTTGNLVMQYTSKVRFAGDIDRYEWTFEGYWDALYAALRDTQNMIAISSEAGLENYEGIGLVMRSWGFSLLTDAYGAIPYTEALQGREGLYAPAYDAQEVVYEGVLNDLRRANELLDPSGESVSGDILYGGDIMRWKKMANSLRLRLLMRLSTRRDVAGKLQEILDNPGRYPVFTSNDDNAALEYLESPPNQWPIHTSRIGSFTTYRLSTTLDSVFTALDDPRLSVFFDPTGASMADSEEGLTFAGVPNGLSDDASSNYNGGSSNQSTINQEKYFDEPNAADGLVMTYAEVLFIQAEAAERGWIEGDAARLYRDGIQASFDQYGVEAPDGYFAQGAVAYAASQEKALRQIGTQKWASLYYTGLEAWFDWRRTGYPAIKPSVENVNGDRIPVRFRYPTDVQSLNASSYEKAIERQGEDNINTHLWVDPSE